VAWSIVFLAPWCIIFVTFPDERRKMWYTSLFTMPFGLTEPLFVPRYWNPPSLFDLAQKTGFDIESLIFCFGIGGVGAVLYDLLTGRRSRLMDENVRHSPLHRHHMLALLSPVVAFVVLVFLPWNPIYPGIVAMAVGAIAAILCRPDLKTKTWVGGVLFLVYYWIFLEGLRFSSPGYIERVWNLPVLIGTKLFGLPLGLPVQDRRALFDVAVAGPLAGLVFAIPALLFGLPYSKVVTDSANPELLHSGVEIGSSFLMAILSKLALGPAAAEGHRLILHPLAFAGWLGLLLSDDRCHCRSGHLFSSDQGGISI